MKLVFLEAIVAYPKTLVYPREEELKRREEFAAYKRDDSSPQYQKKHELMIKEVKRLKKAYQHLDASPQYKKKHEQMEKAGVQTEQDDGGVEKDDSASSSSDGKKAKSWFWSRFW
uniref:Uncharacterized protein n=1 Tax=Chromera velia CCMP2878 TaxID=1169474 RepID=A0A0G4GSN9_9ALVE|eukprot:Cvel_23163.t1-p1 / transcript=Cvel_23163.t1 / gene=Cvel_23163 / organism=Chromera_velia_CCMP2878 / gene_product=hypothetical protein / transcript_product=hypothetical protein / location=Cvel_scaffold2357:12983-15164(+) / protein_length=114 / sequence_SO=supercontig / SO=protein_coding / is_pseudo=false